MIHKLEISNPKISRFPYIENIEYFRNNPVTHFKPGMNLIIGDNGCGKSTLLNLIKFYFLEMKDEIPALESFDHLNFFNTKYNSDLGTVGFYQGVNIFANYNLGTYSFTPEKFLNNDRQLEVPDLVQKLDMDTTRHSKGENGINIYQNWLYKVYSDIYDQKLYQHPLNVLKKFKTVFSDAYTDAETWYERNQVNDDIPTLILDEPEANLSVLRIMMMTESLKGMIKSWRDNPLIQYIMVVHDPYVINQLSKLDNVNIIEMTRHYQKLINRYFQQLD